MSSSLIKVQNIITNIISNNISSDDIIWIDLRQILESSNSSLQPLIRSNEIIKLLEQGLSSSIHGFRELVFEQLSKQMKYEGSQEFICKLPFLLQIINSIEDDNTTIFSYIENILSYIGFYLLTNYLKELSIIANKNEENFIKVYSILFKSGIKDDSVIPLLHLWIEKYHDKMKLTETCDTLIILNLIEIEIEFINSISNNKNTEIQLTIWNYIKDYIEHSLTILLSDKNILLVDLIIAPLIRFFSEGLKLYILLKKNNIISCDNTYKLDTEFIKLINKYINDPNESIQEAIILGLGYYNLSKESQNILFNNKDLLLFYKDSLYKSKIHYLSFIHSITVILDEYKGDKLCKEFLDTIIENSNRMEIILKYMNSQFINERIVFYKFLEQLAAIYYGRNYIFTTNGLLLWLTDRNQIIELHLESNWRYSILQQLVSNKEHCIEKIGSNGYIRIKNYISDGIYHSISEPKVAIYDETQ